MKKYYNITASDFINDLRLTFVANRLLNSDTPIIDICYESGFSNLGWMYTLFKKKYTASPSAFRKKNKAKIPCGCLPQGIFYHALSNASSVCQKISVSRSCKASSGE